MGMNFRSATGFCSKGMVLVAVFLACTAPIASARISGFEKGEPRLDFCKPVEMTGLSQSADRRAAKLPGGMSQRRRRPDARQAAGRIRGNFDGQGKKTNLMAGGLADADLRRGSVHPDDAHREEGFDFLETDESGTDLSSGRPTSIQDKHTARIARQDMTRRVPAAE